MKKLFMLFQMILLTTLLTSCATGSEPTVNSRYAEEKNERTEITFSEKFGDLLDSYTTETGDIYSLYCREQNEKHSYIITKRSQNSDNEESIPLQLDETVNYLFLCADSEGTILLADTTTLYVFRNGEERSSLNFPAWAAGGVLITDNHSVICQTFYDSSYYIFDLATGTRKGTFLEKDFLFEQGNCHPFLYGTYGQELLLASAGIYEHTGDSWELRVPAGGTSMSKAGFLATGIEKGTNDIYLVYDSDYQYTYFPKEYNEAEEERQITLRVTVWQDRYTLKTALAEYQIANPDVIIEYTFRCKDLPETRQEANTLLQQTNAELVSPQAADLYVLDHLPWEQYQAKGFLMDLSEIVWSYSDDDEYFGNILTAYERKEGLYVVPWFFSAKFAVCKQELAPYVQSIHDLAGYLESHPEDPGLVPYYYRDMPELFLAMMYDYYGNDLYEDGKTVTLKSVEHFLESAKIIYDRQQANSSATLLPDYSKEYYNYSYLQQYSCGTDFQLLVENKEGSLLLLPATPMGIIDLLEVYKYPDYTFIPIDGFHSQFLFGINSQSKEKEAAADLLKFLLSYYKETGEADSSLKQFFFIPGVPIYKPILTEQFKKQYDFSKTSASDADPPEGQSYPTTADMETVLKLLSEFHIPQYSADAITNDTYSIFQERSQGYLIGEKTLEEAAEDVYNGLMLLYHESQ